MNETDRILKLAKEKGVKQSFINDLVHGYRGKVTEWKNGKSSPDENELKVIADFFNVSVDYLKGDEQKEKPDIPEDIRLEINNYAEKLAKLPEEKKQLILQLIRSYETK